MVVGGNSTVVPPCPNRLAQGVCGSLTYFEVAMHDALLVKILWLAQRGRPLCKLGPCERGHRKKMDRPRYRDGEQDLPKEDLGVAVVEAALPLYKAEQVAARGPDVDAAPTHASVGGVVW